jgi:hypothetical protein
MNIKHILAAALVAVGLGLAALVPEGQQVIVPAKTSPTAWAVAGRKPGVAVGNITTDGSKCCAQGGDMRSHE